MARSKIVKYTSEELEEKRRRGESKTDWERVRKMKDVECGLLDGCTMKWGGWLYDVNNGIITLR